MWVTRQKKTQSVRISVIINNNTFTNIFIRIILTILTGTISKAEAREALRKHKGNIWASVTECVEGRQQKYDELHSKGNFTREDIVTMLTAHEGNVDAAFQVKIYVYYFKTFPHKLCL